MKKLIYLSLLILAPATICFGQGTGYVKFGSNGSGSPFLEIIPVENGNYLTVGYTSNVHTREIVKLDQNFTPIWAKSYSNADITGFPKRPLALLKDGSYAVLGFSPGNNGSALVLKFSPAGDVLLQKEYSYAGNFLTVFAISAAAGNDPGFIMGGGACARNNFLIKCDANGAVQWAKEFNVIGTIGVKSVFSIAATNSGYLAAFNLLGTPDNTTDAAVMKVSAAGTLEWSKRLRMDNASERPIRIIRLSNGGFAMLSTHDYTGSPDQIYFLDSTAAYVIYKRYDYSVDSYLRDIADDGVSGVVAVGHTYGGVQNEDIIYMHTSYTGDINWQKKSKGTGLATVANFYSVVRTAGNKFVMSGMAFNSGQTVGLIDAAGAGLCVESPLTMTASVPIPLTVVAQQVTTLPFTLIETPLTLSFTPASLTKTTLCGMLSGVDEQTEQTTFSVFPNPSAGTFSLTFSDLLHNAEVTVHNMLGKVIYQSALPASATSLVQLGNVAAGMYVVQVSNGSRQFVERIVVE